MNIPVSLPQELLNRIHESGITELCSNLAQWSPSQKKAEIKLVRAKLRIVKQQIKAKKDDISSAYDARKSDEKRRKESALEPFVHLETFIDEIEVGILEIETGREPQTLSSLLPLQFIVDDVISDLESAITLIADHIITKQGQLAEYKDRESKRQEDPTPSPKDPTVDVVLQLLRGGPAERIEKEILDLQAQAGYIETIAAQRSGIVPQQSLLQTKLAANIAIVHQQLEAASALIKSGEYKEARELLTKINHPKAEEWLLKMDQRGLK